MGVPTPFGETDLDPEGVDVEAKREDTDEFDVLYAKFDTEDAIDFESPPLVFGSLKDGVLEASGRSRCGAFGDVMNAGGTASKKDKRSQFETLPPKMCPAPCGCTGTDRCESLSWKAFNI